MAETQNHVWLNGVQLPLKGPVTWQNVATFPDRFTQSAPSSEDFTPLEKQSWGSLQGGAGIEKWSKEHNDRYWYAEGVDASQAAQVLSAEVTTLGSFGATPVRLIKHNGKIWAIGHQQISQWTGSAWSSKHTTLENPTDAINFYGTA